MTKRTNQPPKPPRIKLGGTSGLLIILALLFAQFVLGIDVLGLNEDTSTNNGGTVIGGGGGSAPPDIPDIIDTSSLTDLRPIPGGYDGGWFQVYFTQPINSTNEADFHGAPIEEALVRLIDSAQQSIDAAIFEMNSEPVTQALIRAHQRGVRVRVVTDNKHGLNDPETTITELQDAGIPVVADTSSRNLMHDKFFVVDGLYVWTGSTNITHNGIYNNNNNAILIRSSRLAQNYEAEFEEMFAGEFGTTSPNIVPNPIVTVDGTIIETIFESEGDAGTRLAQLIQDAHTVRFMAFSFTDSLRWNDNGTERSVMELLRDRAASGELDVRGIVEASSRAFIEPLYCAGVNVRQDGNPDILHHKVFIFDGEIVALGSFNFSNSAASKNDENMLIIHSRALAQAYLEEFNRRWAESEPLPADEFDC